MEKKITRRQLQFFRQFLDVYQELKRPLHYGVIAERLGVGKISAYDMLRLLEEHGLVLAAYEAIPEQHGPGRPAVLFSPTAEGIALTNQPVSEMPDLSDWNAIRTSILEQVRACKSEDFDRILTELLARIPERRNPLLFCSEFITASLIWLFSLPKSVDMAGMMDKLKKIGLPGEIGLSAMSGISLTLSYLERINRRFSTQMVSQIKPFEDSLSQLDEENRQRVSSFARDVVKLLTE